MIARRGDSYRGVALSTALWLFVVMTALGTVFLILMSQSFYTVSKLRYEQGAYYCAYSGVLYAKAKLDNDSSYTPSTPDLLTLPVGSASVTGTRDGSNDLVLTSRGLFGQGGRTLAAQTIKATLSPSGSILEWHNL